MTKILLPCKKSAPAFFSTIFTDFANQNFYLKILRLWFRSIHVTLCQNFKISQKCFGFFFHMYNQNKSLPSILNFVRNAQSSCLDWSGLSDCNVQYYYLFTINIQARSTYDLIGALRWSGLRAFHFSQFKSFFFFDGINVSSDHKTFVMADVMRIIKTNFKSPTFRSIKQREIIRMGYF